MNNLKFLAITFVIIVLQTNLKGQISYSDNTISPTALFPSALGKNNTIIGNYAFVGGINSSTLGEGSFSFGNQAIINAAGINAVALGFFVESNAPASFTLGRFLKSNASAAFVLGSGDGSNGYLINQTAGSLMVGFNSQYPTLFVSNSPGGSFTGKIGIGNITNPTAKLHLFSDDGEAAELKLEHRTTGFRQYSQIYLGTHTIRAGNSENMVFTTPTSKHFAFMTGNVGVGTTEPVAKLQITDGDVYIEDIGSGIIMKSPDGQCWRGKLSNTGVLEFNPINCENLTAAIKAPEKNSEEFQVFPNPSAGLCTVTIPNTIMGASLNIYNMDGVCLLKKTITTNNSYLDLTHFAKGTYLVELVAEGMQKRNRTLILN